MKVTIEFEMDRKYYKDYESIVDEFYSLLYDICEEITIKETED